MNRRESSRAKEPGGRLARPRDVCRCLEEVLGVILTLSLGFGPWGAAPVSAETPEGPSGAADLLRSIEAYSNLRVGPDAVPVHGLKLDYGHLSLLLKSGSATKVFVGNRAVGVFFKGEGVFEYTSKDADEFPTMAFNLEKGTYLHHERSEAGYRISDPFGMALVWSGTDPPQLPAGPPAAALTKQFEKHRQRFLREEGIPPPQIFAMHDLNVSDGMLVRVEIGDSVEDLVYVLDEKVDRRETLYSLHRAQSSDTEVKDRLYASVLSEQPLGRDRRHPPEPHFLLTAVECTLIASGGKDATVSVLETIVPRRDGLSALRFSLYDRMYGLTSTGVLDRRDLHVRRIADESGRDLAFHHKDDSLLVGLGAPAPRDKPIRLHFEIEGPILIRPRNDSYWQLGPGPWFPQPEIVGRCYTFRATVKVRKPFIAFGPGKTVARREEGDFNVLEGRCDAPIRNATILAGQYEFLEDTRAGLTIRVATYADIRKDSIEKLTNMAFGVIGFYEPFLGRFPFDEYTIIEINSYGWGLAPPGMMFITKEVFGLPERWMMPYLHGGGARFAHEIAHQYWGHVVRTPSSEENWLSEAFAEYCAALVVRAAKGDAEFKKIVANWRANALEAVKTSSIALANQLSVPLDESVASEKRAALVYAKGACLLATLHKELGEEKFPTFLRTVQNSFRWKAGTTLGVQKALERVAQRDYSSFFEEYYWGTAMPACVW